MDVKHPDYQSSAERQFLIKCDIDNCVAVKFEFERDLLLNDVEYEEHVESFMQRNKQSSDAVMKKCHIHSLIKALL